MYEIISSLIKYIFITVIYLFLLGIIRLIYLDIGSINKRAQGSSGNTPYLKLINRRDTLDFKIEESYVLDRNKKIGRARKNDIVIPDPYISHEHARVIREKGMYTLQDMGSTNGTFINGSKLVNGTVALKNGDSIEFGNITFLFVENN